MLHDIDRFVNWMRRRNSRARAWRDYRNDLTQFVERLNHISAAEVTLHDVDCFDEERALPLYSHRNSPSLRLTILSQTIPAPVDKLHRLPPDQPDAGGTAQLAG